MFIVENLENEEKYQKPTSLFVEIQLLTFLFIPALFSCIYQMFVFNQNWDHTKFQMRTKRVL